MRAILLAIVAAAFGVAYKAKDRDAPIIQTVEYIGDETAACSCQNGGKCDCDDCSCDRCKTVAKQSLATDPLTGIEVSGPAIVQLSIAGCGPCIRWMNQEAPRYELKGWQVTDPVYGITVPAYPSFRIYDGKRWHQHTGWLTGDDMRRILGGGTASSSNPRASAGAAVVRDPAAAAVSFGRDWLIGGQPWTRQSLINHLATHSSHGHSRASLQSMSLDQLNALHNADHESQRAPVRSAVMSGCPGGSCPPATRTHRGLFGRRW